MQTLRIYNLNIEMEFGIEKCAMLIMKNGKEKQRKELKRQIKKELKRKITGTWEC